MPRNTPSPTMAPSANVREDVARRVPTLAARITMVIAVAVLVGWAFGIESLKSVLPGFVAMKLNTAVGLLAAASSLALLAREPLQLRAIMASRVAAAAVVLLGLLTLAEYVFGVNLGIDQLVGREPTNAIGTLAPGRMAPLSTVQFVLAGSALLLASFRRTVTVAQLVALVVGFGAMVPIIGYLYQATSQVGVGRYALMSIPTCAGFLLLSLGVLLLSPEHGLMKVVVSDSLGGWMLRRMLPILVIGSVSLGKLHDRVVQLGFVEDRYSSAVTADLALVFFFALLWWFARAVNRSDSARRRAGDDARENSDRLEIALAAGQHGLYDVNFETGETKVDAQYARMLGEDPATFVETHAGQTERCHPDDRAAVLQAYEGLFGGNDAVSRVEFRRRMADGRWAWTSSSARVVARGADGHPRRMIGARTDISALKEHQARLGQDVDRASALLALQDAAMRLNETELLQFGLDAAERLTGSRIAFIHYVHEATGEIELVTWSHATLAEYCTALHDVHYPVDRAGIWADAYRRRAPVVFNDYAGYQDKRGLPEGHSPLHRLIVVPVVEDGEVRMLTGVGNKATDYVDADVETLRLYGEQLWALLQRRRAESAHELQTAALTAAANAIAISNRDGVIQWANPAWTGLTGYSLEESARRTMRELIGVDAQDPGFSRTNWQTLQEGQEWDNELTCLRKDGTEISVALAVTPVRGASGEVEHFVAILRDLTEDKETQERLLQVEKLESVGRLAGGLAHDFNNMLGVIIGRASLARREVPPAHPVLAHLEDIENAAKRSSTLTGQLLAFARRQVFVPRVLDLNQTIENMLKSLRRLVGETVQVKWQPDPGLWPVHMDPGQVDEVLAALSVNAREAMPQGGTLSISTLNVSRGAVPGGAIAEARASDYVRLDVRDTGCGMDAETRARLFEPFFTTKPLSEGMGLSLAMVHGVVQQNSGWIEVVTAPGQGTTFSICIPRDRAAAVPAADVVAKPLPSGAAQTVLLAEDEPLVLEVGELLLRELGYEVLTAGGGAEAIELSRRHEGPIDILMTDVVMPVVNGLKVAETLRVERPGIKVLFVSGYTEDVIGTHGRLPPDIHFLEKPFTIDSVAAALRSTVAT